MSPETVLTIGDAALELTIMLMLLLLGPALAVGLLVSLFQAATQINEMTLSFVPKLMIIAVVMMTTGPWMIRQITGFTTRLIENVPYMIG